MDITDTTETTKFFEVVAGTERSQAATMVLSPGQSTGGPDNQHPETDQWLYVTMGTGMAIVDGEEHIIESGALVLIEAGETHEIRNHTDEPLETVNVYAPPTY